MYWACCLLFAGLLTRHGFPARASADDCNPWALSRYQETKNPALKVRHFDVLDVSDENVTPVPAQASASDQMHTST